jgi:hypothetical protein
MQKLFGSIWKKKLKMVLPKKQGFWTGFARFRGLGPTNGQITVGVQLLFIFLLVLLAFNAKSFLGC